MRAAVVAAAAAVVLAAPGAAAAEQHTVTAPGLSFDPSRLTVVVGDEVTWRVTDVQTHDVHADDGSFASGRLGRFGAFTARFDRVGSSPYLCTVHPFMRGQVDAVAALLRAPAGPVLAGETVRLEGRSGPGASVALERRLGDGGWQAIGRAVAAADGAFAFAVDATEGAVYRPVTAAGAGPEVAHAVTARLHAEIGVRPGRRRAHVLVRTRPRQPELVATLQRYSRERFMWRRVAHARLDRRGRARFKLRPGRGGRVRLLLSRSPRGPALAVSDVVRVQDGRRVPDPYTPHPLVDSAMPDSHG